MSLPLEIENLITSFLINKAWYPKYGDSFDNGVRDIVITKILFDKKKRNNIITNYIQIAGWMIKKYEELPPKFPSDGRFNLYEIIEGKYTDFKYKDHYININISNLTIRDPCNLLC